MRRFILRCVALGLGALHLAHASPAAAPGPFSVRIMTFNLRFASDTPPHAWPERRPIMRRLLEREAPDICGTQEGLHAQLNELAADLPNYAWVGLGREGGSRGEFMAIFYRRDRFEPVAFDHFWLSGTPEVIGSATWGNRFKRMVTWVRLRERSTGREIEVWNTHLDHEVADARRRSAELIAARLPSPEVARPLVLLGDFNCLARASEPYTILTRGTGLQEVWSLAREQHQAKLNTFHGYAPPGQAGEHIDWILVRGARAVPRAAVVDYGEQGRSPSDHFPVSATVEF